jgi:hypothetical protein
MGGAPWVAERNTKIADGVLNMSTLAADAFNIFGKLIAAGENSGVNDDSKKYIAVRTHAQFQKHAVLSSSKASFWQGLTKLTPEQRRQFREDFSSHLDGNVLPAKADFIAAKSNASLEEAWSAVLGAKPIDDACEQISSSSGLKELQDKVDVLSDPKKREEKINEKIKEIRTNISAVTIPKDRASQALAQSLEVGKSIERDAEAVMGDLPHVREHLSNRAEELDLALPSFNFLNGEDISLLPDKASAFAQERMLNVLEEAFKFLPYEGHSLSDCRTLASFHSNPSAKGKQASTAKRLYDALQTLSSYVPPRWGKIAQKNCQPLVEMGQRILELKPPNDYVPLIKC